VVRGIQCWQTQKQLSVAAPDMKTFEGGIAPHPVESSPSDYDIKWLNSVEGSERDEGYIYDSLPKQNHVPSMSMDDGLKLIDARRARQQIHAPNDALDSGTSSWPQQDKRKYEEVLERDVAPRQVKVPRQIHAPSMSMDDGLETIDAWMPEPQVRAFNDALGINSGTTSQGEKERRIIVAEPGSQPPGGTVNYEAPRLPKEYSSQTTRTLARLDRPNRRFYPR
jgi:hypothetical protein